MEKLKIANAQENLVNLVRLVTEENKIYEIDNYDNSAVLISRKEYEALQETIELNSIPNLRESLQISLQQVIDNETYSLDEVLGDIN